MYRYKNTIFSLEQFSDLLIPILPQLLLVLLPPHPTSITMLVWGKKYV